MVLAIYFYRERLGGNAMKNMAEWETSKKEEKNVKC